MKKANLELLHQLFKDWAGEDPVSMLKMPESGSSRQYYRIVGSEKAVLGVHNEICEENEAYFAFTEHFSLFGVPVPKIIGIASDRAYYLVEDLGDDSLYNRVLKCQGNITPDVMELYQKALKNLIKMQVKAGETLNYSYCYPVQHFDHDAIQWDLNYFKYSYLKLAGIEFNEYLLEKDFKALKAYLMEVPMDFFMFRDFQSRNIIIRDKDTHFIDFQGGRKGPLAYDVASLLFQAKAQIPTEVRNALFDFYYQELSRELEINYTDLQNSYKVFALLRGLQVLGAYGFRGYFEKKSHFIESIPFAINNLKELLLDADFPLQLPHIREIVKKLHVPSMHESPEHDMLTVNITSFSYRKGIPSDPSENGGGFVFDCRSIHNPGRYEAYKNLTGKDTPVMEFFEREHEMEDFLAPIFTLVETSVEVYQKRHFSHLMVNFGCTGGQHRSVYAAERLAKHLREKYAIKINLWHREQD